MNIDARAWFTCLVVVVGAGANPSPDPEDCTVLPLDNQDVPRIVGIASDSGSHSAALLDIWIIGYGGYPWVHGHVSVEFPGGTGSLCICEDAVLSGITDEEGHVQLKVLLGGCLEGSDVAQVMLDGGFPIRSVDYVVSPDWNGAECDARMDLGDFIFFESQYTTAAGGCADYTGDGRTSLADFSIFGAQAWGRSCSPRGAKQPQAD